MPDFLYYNEQIYNLTNATIVPREKIITPLPLDYDDIKLIITLQDSNLWNHYLNDIYSENNIQHLFVVLLEPELQCFNRISIVNWTAPYKQLSCLAKWTSPGNILQYSKEVEEIISQHMRFEDPQITRFIRIFEDLEAE